MRLFICGDICLSGEPEQRALADPEYNVWAGIRTLLNEKDILIANLECALTDRGTPRPFKWANLRATPVSARSLKGLNIAVLGNNHVSDFGEEGVSDTLETLRQLGIRSVGYGDALEEALRPTEIQCDGVRIALVSLVCPTTNGENLATHTTPGTAPLGMQILRSVIEKNRAQADILLVYLHWGYEQSHSVTTDQIRLARRAIDWGADAVIGTHGHVIQPYECYKGKWIFYGLGNFLFGTVETTQTKENGTQLRGKQEQTLPNRQSLVISFELSSTYTTDALQLADIQPVEFDENYVPRFISKNQLTVNLDQINCLIERYTRLYPGRLKGDTEVSFTSQIRNGILTYFYPTRPISFADISLSTRCSHYLKRTVQKLLAPNTRHS